MITFFSSLADNFGARKTANPHDLLKTAPARRASKGALPAWSPALFQGDLRRKRKSRIESVAALVYDLDHGGLEAVLDRLRVAGIEALAHTTFTHTPQSPRWRLILPLSHPVTAQIYTSLLAEIRHRFVIPSDAVCSNPGWIWLAPGVHPKRAEHYRTLFAEGTPLDPTGIAFSKQTAHAAIPTRRTKRTYRQLALAPDIHPVHAQRLACAILASLSVGALDGRRNELAMTLGAAMAQRKLSRGCVKPLTQAWLTAAAELNADARLDIDGTREDGWIRRALDGYDAAVDGASVRGFGSLRAEHPRIAEAVRRACVALVLRSPARDLAIASEATSKMLARARDSDFAVMAPTCGSGKSRALRVLHAEETSKNGLVWWSVPTHALAEQTGALLLEEHDCETKASSPSILAVRDVSGEVVCTKPQRVRLAILQGASGRTACIGCNQRDACTAKLPLSIGSDTREAHLAPHERLRERLCTLEKHVEASARSVRMIIDEPPPLFVSGPWDLLAQAASVSDCLTQRGRVLLDAAFAIERGEKISEEQRAAALTDAPLIARGGVRMASRLVEIARSLDAVAEAIVLGVEKRFVVTSTAGGAARKFFRAPASWVRAAKSARDAGVKITILDATADDAAYQEAFGVSVERVHVADAPSCKRAYVYESSVGGSHLTPAIVQRVVKNCKAAVGDRAVSSLGIVTRIEHKKHYKEALSAAFAGAVVKAAHFGAERGMDTLSDVDVLFIIGEPWYDRERFAIDAAASGTDDINERWEREMQRALVQAEGRARLPFSKQKKLLVRVTRTEPDIDLAPQWSGCMVVDDRRVGSEKDLSAGCGISLRAARKLARSWTENHRKSLGKTGVATASIYTRATSTHVLPTPYESIATKPDPLVCGDGEGSLGDVVDAGGRTPMHATMERVANRRGGVDPGIAAPRSNGQASKAADPSHVRSPDRPAPGEKRREARGALSSYAEGQASGKLDHKTASETDSVDAYCSTQPTQLSLTEDAALNELANDAFSGTALPTKSERVDRWAMVKDTMKLVPALKLDASPIPKPPLLDAGAEVVDNIHVLLSAFRTIVERRYPTRGKNYAYARGVTVGSAQYARFAQAASLMIEHAIAPLAWCEWSVDAWQAMQKKHGKPLTQPPNSNFVLHPQRVTKHVKWFKATAPSFGAGASVLPPSAEAYNLLRYRLLAAVDRGEVSAAAPDRSWDTEAEIASADMAKCLRRLKARVAQGEFIWDRNT